MLPTVTKLTRAKSAIDVIDMIRFMTFLLLKTPSSERVVEFVPASLRRCLLQVLAVTPTDSASAVPNRVRRLEDSRFLIPFLYLQWDTSDGVMRGWRFLGSRSTLRYPNGYRAEPFGSDRGRRTIA